MRTQITILSRTLLAVSLSLMLTGWVGGYGLATESEPFEAWPEAKREQQRDFEKMLNQVPSPKRLRAWHDLFCQEVHPAGSPADERLIQRMLKAFQEMGIQEERQDLWIYLPHFEYANVTVETDRGEIALALVEEVIPEDPAIAQKTPPAFNAYSASGKAHGQVVYANYGTREDFETLKAMKISCKNRIVIARYGKNFRGFKALYAEKAGAIGLLIYTDPDDSGYRKGLPYPEGGYANESFIQRGSVKTLPYPGDPLTPFVASTKDAKRLNPEDVALPRIPVQPIGWKSAQQILSRMKGEGVPKGWQGGLPFAYRLKGEKNLHVRMEVKQPRRRTRTGNVIGVIKGAVYPDQKIIFGCHLDAWTYGAGDPHAGSIVLFEMARSFANALKKGHRPARTIVFANWGVEEHGIIGSTEWCEAHRDSLLAGGLAYINLDMAAMGLQFWSRADPLLKDVIADATRAVRQPDGKEKQSVYEAWMARSKDKPAFGDLGGGSDHIGFYCHLGIPSCNLGGTGSKGVAYHSAYDTLAWYRKVVGDDYKSALMLTHIGNILAARLANAPLIPFDLARVASDTRRHLSVLEKESTKKGRKLDFKVLNEPLKRFEDEARALQTGLKAAVASGACSGKQLERANDLILKFERTWLLEKGLPGHPWYRNAFASSDPYSGYGSWMLPLIHYALEKDPEISMEDALKEYGRLIQQFEKKLVQLRGLLPQVK